MLGAEIAFAFHGPLFKRDAEIFERKRMKQIWLAILQRCNNPRSQMYRHYGGRGIRCTIDSFEAFFAHLGPRPTTGHSVDRIDVNGHYAIGNLRWATWREQATNTTRTAFVEIDGKRYKRTDLAEKYGVTGDQIDYRAKKGGSLDVVISPEPRWDTSSLPLAVAAAAIKRKQRIVCKRGHSLVGENVYFHSGRRHCKECRKQWRPK